MIRYVCILILYLLSHTVIAQQWEFPSLFIGVTYLNDFKVNDTYNPTLIIVHLPYTFKLKQHIKLQTGIEPQFNIVSITTTTTSKLAYEFGINILFRFSYIMQYASIYVQPSIGPHYISDSIESQINGFIFSDNVAIGITKQFDKINIDLQVRYRHMSNAGLKEPNYGIDNLFVLMGIGYYF